MIRLPQILKGVEPPIRVWAVLLRKTDFSSPVSIQAVAPLLGVGASWAPPHQSWSIGWLHPVPVTTMAAVTSWVQWPCHVQTLFSRSLPQPLALSVLLCHLLYCSPRHWEKGYLKLNSSLPILYQYNYLASFWAKSAKCALSTRFMSMHLCL